MSWAVPEMEERDVLSASSPSYLPLTTFTAYSNVHSKDSTLSPPPPTSSSGNKISPAVLFIIVILAVIFFISGLLHLLVRLLIKQPSSSSNSQSNRYPDVSGSDALQRQLQQLFHLHDSGLDQAFIDALPVFLYKEIMGLKEPFDCAVCLSEFSENDKLRLLPLCSHAFHLHCIDTWLLSNSSCPLCRGTLMVPGLPFENPVFEYSVSREEDRFPSNAEDELPRMHKPVENEEIVGEKKSFPVRLGKFRSLNDGEHGEQAVEAAGETSSSNLDARRCFSMGSFQYVLGDSNLQVALPQVQDGMNRQLSRRSGINENFSAEVDVEGKRLCNRSRGESFSVSKIWLWSKNGKLSSTSDTSSVVSSNTHQLPTWMRRTQDV